MKAAFYPLEKREQVIPKIWGTALCFGLCSLLTKAPFKPREFLCDAPLFAYCVVPLFAYRVVPLFAYCLVPLFAYRVVTLFAYCLVPLFAFCVVPLFAYHALSRQPVTFLIT